MQQDDHSKKEGGDSYPHAYNYAYAAPDPNADSSGISIVTHYLGLLRRRFWIILPFVLLLLAMGVIKAAKAPKIYAAKAKVIVEKNQPNIMSFDRNAGYSGYDPKFAQNQTEQIKSRVVMEIALEDPAIQKLFTPKETHSTSRKKTSLAADIKKTVQAAMGGDPAPAPAPWELLSGRVTATPEQDSTIIAIHVTSGTPEHTALIANATAVAFREYYLRLKLDVLNQAAGTLITEKDKQEKLFLAAEQALQNFYESAQGFSGESAQPANNKLTSINSQRTGIQLDIMRCNIEIEIMKQITSTNETVSASASQRIFTIPIVQSSQNLQTIKASISQAKQDLLILSETYGEQNPMIINKKREIRIYEDEFWNSVQNLIITQEQRITMLQKEDSLLLEQYEEQKSELLNISEEAFTLQRLKDTISRHRSLYDALAERTAQLEVSTSLATTNVQIIEEAAVPTRYLPQNKKETILKYLMIGFILGGGLACLLEALDKTIKTPEDLVGAVDVPLLGFIPTMEDDSPTDADASPPGIKNRIRKKMDMVQKSLISITGQKHSRRQGRHVSMHIWQILQDALIKLGALTGSEYIPTAAHYRQRGQTARREYIPSPILTDSQSSISEAYRHIRTNLMYSNVDQNKQILTVTSCGPKEGKTTTSANLALSIAMSRKKVLLIDADLHRPKIHLFLGLNNGKNTAGLTSALVGEISWKKALQKTRHEEYIVGNLDVLTAGPTSPHPAELLGSEAMKGILKEARLEYDWIIIDTPPVLFVSDAVVMSSFSDGTILVVKAGTNTKGLLDRTKSQLDNVQANIIGSILNNMILSRMGRYYSYYGYHGYSSYSKDYHKTYYSDDE